VIEASEVDEEMGVDRSGLHSGRLATRGKRGTSGLWVCTEGLRASSELLVMYVRGTSAKALTMTV
jgi:hypothetical protein